MSFQKKSPSIRIELNQEAFNLLVGILELEHSFNTEIVSDSALALKNKIMTYSVPKIDEENEEYIDTRFFPSEMNSLVNLLLLAIDHKEEKNYYSELVERRKNNGKEIY